MGYFGLLIMTYIGTHTHLTFNLLLKKWTRVAHLVGSHIRTLARDLFGNTSWKSHFLGIQIKKSTIFGINAIWKLSFKDNMRFLPILPHTFITCLVYYYLDSKMQFSLTIKTCLKLFKLFFYHACMACSFLMHA